MRTSVVIAIIAIASLTTEVAFAGGGHGGGMDDHGSGHGMTDEHGRRGGSRGRHTNARTVPGAREIPVRAKSFAFTPDEITVTAGEDVTIVLTSKDILHDFVVKGEGHVVAAKGKKTKRGGLNIDEAGTYRFWCSVAGHRRAGMQGKIVVQ